MAAGPAGTRAEIWSFGLRNPWRYTFDDPARGGTGAMVMGDVGQSAFEEIDYEPRGPRGPQLRLAQPRRARTTTCTIAAAGVRCRSIDPIFEYGRSDGAVDHRRLRLSRSRLGAAYRGRYFFADFVQGRVWSMALTIDANGDASGVGSLVEHTRELGGDGDARQRQLVWVDADGELFIVSYSWVRILRVFNARAAAHTNGAAHCQPE